MDRITSFTVDHDLLTEGIYVSRIDGDITTYDMRTRVPNSGDYMDTTTAHTVEHMFATFVRNSEIGGDVIYFGPHGLLSAGTQRRQRPRARRDKANSRRHHRL